MDVSSRTAEEHSVMYAILVMVSLIAKAMGDATGNPLHTLPVLWGLKFQINSDSEDFKIL